MSRYGSAQIRSTDFAGEVLTPGMDGYAEAAATVFATGTPDVVVRPADAGDLASAFRSAAEVSPPFSVRSGGHSVAGLSTHADGMVIDLRRISRVEVIDQATRRVRIGAGATWGAVAAALQPHGLGITAGDTNQVGVGGLTLGGGIGWMVRRYGLAIDRLPGADLGHGRRAAAARRHRSPQRSVLGAARRGPQHLPRSQLNEPAASRRRYRTRAVSAADPAVRRISDCIDGQEVLW